MRFLFRIFEEHPYNPWSVAVTNKIREAGLLPIFRENEALQDQLRVLELLQKIDIREVEIKSKPKLEIDPVLKSVRN